MMNTGSKIRSALLASALIAVATLTSSPAHAVVGTLDRVPAATLLLPYFEVDEVDPNGAQTRFTVLNSSMTPQLTHVTLWTDMGVPTFAFDVYLGGRDSAEVDLRLLFTRGILPQTSPVSFAAGPDSAAHAGSVSGCSATAQYAGYPAPDALTTNQLLLLRTAHRGDPSSGFGNMCSAAHYGDRVARGYITIDAANGCSSKFASDAGYFISGGAGVASNNNVLFGTYTVIDRGSNVSTASPLVAIEASDTDPATTTNGAYTFYAGYVNATAADNRESLPTIWHARTLDVDFFDAGTDLVVWRDPGFAHSPFVCGSLPSDFPRKQEGIAAFDEQEHPTVLNGIDYYPNPQPPPVYPFPYLAQRVPAALMSPYPSGFIWTNLNETLSGMPAAIQGREQSYIGVRQRLNGVFGAELPAVNVPDLENGSSPF